jgi:hypothetical protein
VQLYPCEGITVTLLLVIGLKICATKAGSLFLGCGCQKCGCAMTAAVDADKGQV